MWSVETWWSVAEARLLKSEVSLKKKGFEKSVGQQLLLTRLCTAVTGNEKENF